jgi:hypothetical protein
MKIYSFFAIIYVAFLSAVRGSSHVYPLEAKEVEREDYDKTEGGLRALAENGVHDTDSIVEEDNVKGHRGLRRHRKSLFFVSLFCILS